MFGIYQNGNSYQEKKFHTCKKLGKATLPPLPLQKIFLLRHQWTHQNQTTVFIGASKQGIKRYSLLYLKINISNHQLIFLIQITPSICQIYQCTITRFKVINQLIGKYHLSPPSTNFLLVRNKLKKSKGTFYIHMLLCKMYLHSIIMFEHHVMPVNSMNHATKWGFGNRNSLTLNKYFHNLNCFMKLFKLHYSEISVWLNEISSKS